MEIVISLAAERDRRRGLRPTREEYIGALFEWQQLGERLSVEELQQAVGYLRSLPAPRPAAGLVLPFQAVRAR